MKSYKKTSYILLVVSFLFFSSCIKQKTKEKSKALVVMTYNVENLFDNADDPNKEDETYLPIELKKTKKHRKVCAKMKNSYYKSQCLKTDWSDAKIKIKLERIADVILKVNGGLGPDVLVLTEVENLSILERLRTTHLKDAGFHPSILIEGPDERGIDVAILSKLPLINKPRLNLVDLRSIKKTNRNVRPTRGILQAQFKLPDGQALTVFACHFPSQGSPSSYRIKAIETLSQLKAQLPKDEFVIAAGDFNITREEDNKEKLITKKIGDQWMVSHLIGCSQCKGTHNYRGDWSFLDLILFSNNFKKGLWQVDVKSISVANQSDYQLDLSGRPARFEDGRKRKGVSDHLPLVAEILPNESK